MRTVAARAGVSTATVSRVISGSDLVRPETAALVQRIIDELNFVPNASATTLKYGRSDIFGIIIANVTNPFFMEFIRDFEALLPRNQQGVLLANAELPERVETSIRRMLTSQVDGVVVMLDDEEFGASNRLALRNVPVVTIDRHRAQPLVSDISFRFNQGMLQAVSHLQELGHQHIGLIGGTETLGTSRIRVKAFLAAMRRCKIAPRSEWIVSGDYLIDGGDRQMRALMSLPTRPTAVIAANDLMALGAIRAAHALQMSVPRDVSIVGFDDIMLADIVSPALTTVHLSRKLVAEACMRAFSHMAANPKSDGLQILIETNLIVRRSTAPPAKANKKTAQSKKTRFLSKK